MSDINPNHSGDGLRYLGNGGDYRDLPFGTPARGAAQRFVEQMYAPSSLPSNQSSLSGSSSGSGGGAGDNRGVQQSGNIQPEMGPIATALIIAATTSVSAVMAAGVIWVFCKVYAPPDGWNDAGSSASASTLNGVAIPQLPSRPVPLTATRADHTPQP